MSFMNIYYIRAAIREKCGITLKLEEVRDLLVEEGFLSISKAKHIVFRGYSEFYDYFYKQDDNTAEIKKEKLTPPDLIEYMEEEHIEEGL